MRALATVAMLVVAAMLSLDLSAAKPVAAANDLELCEAFAQAGAIVVYRCIDVEYDKLIYINSVGFMLETEP